MCRSGGFTYANTDSNIDGNPDFNSRPITHRDCDVDPNANPSWNSNAVWDSSEVYKSGRDNDQ